MILNPLQITARRVLPDTDRLIIDDSDRPCGAPNVTPHSVLGVKLNTYCLNFFVRRGIDNARYLSIAD